ncbi:ZBED1 protein, partial [Polyodon spathula]|nr:ZBED1 protein [Polyodon spathula]
SVVEDRGFNAFFKTLDPRYKIPSRKCLMEGTIADMYKDCQDKVRANCQRAHSVVLTTDMWTSRSTEAYLTVSFHQPTSESPPPGSTSALVPGSTSPVTPASTPSSAPATAKGGIWADFDIQVLSAQQHRSTGTDARIEMHRYLEEKLIPRDQDPLHWWQEHEQTFPSLSRLVAKHLGFIVSSVPSERILSKAGELVRQRRNRLKGGNVNVQLILNKNL